MFCCIRCCLANSSVNAMKAWNYERIPTNCIRYSRSHWDHVQDRFVTVTDHKLHVCSIVLYGSVWRNKQGYRQEEERVSGRLAFQCSSCPLSHNRAVDQQRVLRGITGQSSPLIMRQTGDAVKQSVNSLLRCLFRTEIYFGSSFTFNLLYRQGVLSYAHRTDTVRCNHLRIKDISTELSRYCRRTGQSDGLTEWLTWPQRRRIADCRRACPTGDHRRTEPADAAATEEIRHILVYQSL